MLKVPYTHSGVTASAIAMDKVKAKQVAISLGIQTPEYKTYTIDQLDQVFHDWEPPYVVKSICEGSSQGVFIISQAQEFGQIQPETLGQKFMVEPFIAGRELTVSVLNGKALSVTELKASGKFYDYEAKYTDGVTEHIVPAQVEQKIFDEAQRVSEKMHQFLGCRVTSRSDFRYHPNDGLYFLEINTHPGMTALSLVPEQAKFCGISYEELVDQLVKEATCQDK